MQKIAGRHADARKDFFCGIVTVCRRAVGSVDGARGVQMSFAGHLHAVYPENGIMVFSVGMRLGKAKSEKLCFSICICPRLFVSLM